MARGDIYEATAGTSSDLYYVDTGMYNTPEYGSVYILDAERPALIDTGLGTSYELILDAAADVGVEPSDIEAIIPTHVHLDHAGGAGYLVEECPNADVYVYETGKRFLRDPESLWEGTKAVIGDRLRYYVEPKPVPGGRLVGLGDGDTIDLGDHVLDAYHAPGHAFHQAIFYDRATEGVFVADAAGINTPALDGARYATPPPDFDLEECLEDIETIQQLDPTALYYGHFGDVEPDGVLEAFAETLKTWVARVETKRAEVGDDEALIEYFIERADIVGVWDEHHARGEERLNVQGVLQYLDRQCP